MCVCAFGYVHFISTFLVYCLWCNTNENKRSVLRNVSALVLVSVCVCVCEHVRLCVYTFEADHCRRLRRREREAMSADAIRKLREERQRQYQQLSEAEKPKVKVCPACHQATYLKEICPVTGLYHDLEKKKLIGGSVVEGNVIRSSELMSAIDRTRVKWAASRTQLVKASAQSLNIFQSFVAQMDWNLQRYGLLYGTYTPDNLTVEVHAIYEPEQHGNRFTFEVVEDPRIAKVDAIATGLGLRRVGAICTHPPRNPETIVLNSREMLLCAREQSRFGDECVLLTIAPNESDGVVECQAWQTSPQCVYYYRLGMLHEPAGSPDCLAIPEEARYVETTMELEVTQQDTDSSGKQRFITKAPSKQIDTRWFTSYTAVQQFESEVVRGLFMRISRPGMAPPTFSNLKNYLLDPKRKDEVFAEKIADFHVLIFLAEVFSMEDDVPALVNIVKNRLNSEEAKNYEVILKEYCG